MAAPASLMFTESPFTARQRFQFRPLANWLFCAVVFAATALLLGLIIPGPLVWLADGVAIAILYYANFYVLEHRPIKLRCPQCWNFVRTNTPWVCGFCLRNNEHADEFPVINRCEHCGAEPRAYQCHHCQQLIYLTEDRLNRNFATCLNPPGQAAPPPEDEMTLLRKEKEKLEHEIAMTELTAKLEAGKQRLEFGKKKSPREEIEESFAKYDARVMGKEEFARKQRAIYAERYKDDRDMLDRANEALNDWLRERA